MPGAPDRCLAAAECVLGDAWLRSPDGPAVCKSLGTPLQRTIPGGVRPGLILVMATRETCKQAPRALSALAISVPSKANGGRARRAATGYSTRRRRPGAPPRINEHGTVVVDDRPSRASSQARVPTANIAAEILGIDHSKVTVLIGDTNSVGFELPDWRRRVTFASAMVVTQAAEPSLPTRAAAPPRSGRSIPTPSPGTTAKLPGRRQCRQVRAAVVGPLAARATETGGPIGRGQEHDRCRRRV